MTNQSPPVLFEAAAGVGVVTLNRPENRNSMTSEMLDAFVETLGRARADHELRCLVFTGSGRCFCAGADFRSPPSGVGTTGQGLAHERLLAAYAPFLAVAELELPTIAALNGHAVGGGFGLALVCDLRIGNADAKFGANFARLGIHSGLGISYLLPRLIGVPRALELLLLGHTVRGTEAAEMGLFNRAVPAEEVLPVAMQLAREIATNAPIVLRTMKRTFYQGLGWDLDGAARLEAFAQAATLSTQDAAEGIRALLEKRPPHFKGR